MSGKEDVCRLDAVALARSYRAGELSPHEVVAALIDVAAEAGVRLNALAADAFERAIAEAAAATTVFARRRRNGSPPASGLGAPRPLEGIPLLVKDLFDSEGVVTSYGSPMFAGHLPRCDAAALQRARRAGAILLAKTSTDEFAYGITSHNPHLGAVRNPWVPERISGGSSGGSAAALAAGLAPLALGSDTGGSIRVPAAFCGVVGFKPSFGAVSNEGLFPMARSLDHSGPMARTPADARLLFEAIAEPGGQALRSRPDAERPLRIAVCPDLQVATPTREVEVAFASLLEAARGIGVEIAERRLAGVERVFPTFLTIQRVETSYTHRRRGLYPQRRGEYGADVRERLDVAATVTLDEYLRAEAERERLRRRFALLFHGGALLLAPVQADTPPPIGTAGVEELARDIVMDQTVPQNLFGLPACAIRAGFDAEGVPVGAQLVGPPGADAAVLGAAARLYEATPEVQGRRPEPQAPRR